jgi:hypothetical protein
MMVGPLCGYVISVSQNPVAPGKNLIYDMHYPRTKIGEAGNSASK